MKFTCFKNIILKFYLLYDWIIYIYIYSVIHKDQSTNISLYMYLKKKKKKTLVYKVVHIIHLKLVIELTKYYQKKLTRYFS